MSAPATSSTPKTASGASRNSTPAASGGTGELCQTRSSHPATVMAVMRPVYALAAALIALAAPAAALAQGAPPRERTLSSGWEMRVEPAAPAPPQEAPPEETAPEGEAPAAPATPAGPRRAGAGRVEGHAGAERVRRPRPAVALSGPGAPLPRELPGTAHTARVQLAAALRERAPERGRDPERAPHRPQRRPLHAVHARGPRPAPGPHQRARGDRGRPQEPGCPGGLVELERDRPAGGARARRSGSHPGPGHDVARAVPRPRARLPGGAAARRDAPAPRRPLDRAVARREAALAERPGDHAQLPAPAPALQGTAAPALDARAGAAAVVAGRAPALRGRDHPARARAGGAARTPPDRPALRGGQAGPPVAQQPPHPAARRVDPRGHARLGRGAHRRRHGQVRRGPEGPGREHHARALPAERAAPVPPRPRRHPRLEPGADLAARQRRTAASAGQGARASAAHGAPHGHGRAQPPVGAHPLRRERAHLHAGPAPRHAALPARGAGPGPRDRPDAADLRRHQGTRRLRRAVHLPLVRPDRAQPVLRLVPLGGGLRACSSPTSASCATSIRARRS